MNPKITKKLHFQPRLDAVVSLNGSKSITNRVRVLAALAGGGCELRHAATGDDAEALQHALLSAERTIDIGAAGTAMRFMTAVLTLRPDSELHILTGSERMRRRPIGILVEALRRLGAHIDYVENEGFPPLCIHGHRPTGGEVEIDAGVSSQYISALLMIGPTLSEGLRLKLRGRVASKPYIDMTLRLMRRFGADASWEPDGQTLRVAPRPYRAPSSFDVEPDWSGASYWYELVALSPDAAARVTLPRLEPESVQGDALVVRYFEMLGVGTDFTPQGAVLTKRAATPDGRFELDLSQEPDLAQTLVVTAAMMGRPFRLSGLGSLRIKETDRMAALVAELRKLGVAANCEGDEAIVWDGQQVEPHPELGIRTYDDHRMAMAFAPAAYRFDGLEIHHPEVVRKSYPAFWDDLKRISRD